MVKKRIFLTLAVVGVLLLSACAAAAKQAPSVAPAEPPRVGQMDSMRQEMPAVMATPAPAGGAPGLASNESAAVERLVIKNADLSIVVADPLQSMDSIAKMAEGMGGFVVTSNSYKTRLASGVEVPNANITVRVPAGQLNAALDKIKALVKDPKVDVISENVSGQDVTKEYTDLQSRLRNLRQAEEQLREIMASATKPEDVLNVFNQLTQVREQIEVIQGQIKYYEESAAMSAVSVSLVAEASVEPLTIGGWKPVGVARDAVQTLVNTLQVIANAAIWLVLYVVPVLAVLALPVLLVVWLVRRGLARRKAPTPPPAAPAAS